MTDHAISERTVAEPKEKRRIALLGSVDSLLKFFVLALLIVETFLGGTLVGARLDARLQEVCIWLGVGMFVLVVGFVFFLALVGDEPLIRR